MSNANTERQLPISINTEEEYQHFLNELKLHFSKGTSISNLEDSEIERLKAIVNSLETFASQSLFIIHYTNNTWEIKSFQNSEAALDESYSDHLLEISQIIKKLE